jgi:hypothetical protein
MVKICQFRAHSRQRITQVIFAVRGRKTPAPLAGVADLADKVLAALPGTARKFVGERSSRFARQGSADRDGGSRKSRIITRHKMDSLE